MGAVPRPFLPYAAAVVLAAVAVAATAGTASSFTLHPDAALLLLAAFVVVGELLPIHVPRRAGNDWLTVSSAFGVATLLAYGLWPAIVVYVAATLVGDLAYRARAAVAVFNAAQYVLSLGAAAGVLWLLDAEQGPAVLAGAAAFFVVNELVAGTGSALLAGERVRPYLRRDIGFQLWTGGFQLALAPIVVTVAEAGAWLVPLAFCPLVAVWVGGRQAALNTYRAVRDPLTDLPNRAGLRDACAGMDGSILVLDIALDDLPAIRRTLGHGVVDNLLTAVTARLRGALPEHEVLARLDADELALARRCDNELVAEARIITLLSAFEKPFEVGGLALEVHAVIGASLGDAGDPDAAVDRAALALAAAREAALPWAIHEPAYDERSSDRLALATQLRRGLQRGELVVDYHLKVPLRATGRFGVEALVRWDHPQLGRVAPDGFIDLAERSGLIGPLTEHVLATALRDLRGWLDAGLDVQVAVNVPTVLLGDARLPERVGRHLAAARVPADRLQLEITESRLLGEAPPVNAVIDALRERGVSLAIDDFGVGFSSLSQLRRLPVSELKIDQSFVRELADDRRSAAVVRAAIALGQDLGLDVVAEGVEDATTAHRLRDLGCDYAQGYLYGRPGPAAECARRLRELTRVVRLEAVS